jgi:hypothetical protein
MNGQRERRSDGQTLMAVQNYSTIHTLEGDAMVAIVKRTLLPRLAMIVLALQAIIWKSSVALAQDAKDVNVDINMKGSGGTAWYGIWWVWVLVAVFIIVIVAITSRGSGRSSD